MKKTDRVYDNQDLKTKGWIEDGKFHKRVKKSKHLLRAMDAWGIDYDIIQKLAKKKIKKIKIYEVEERLNYLISVENFIADAKYLQYEGYGLQLFCPRDKFKIIPE